ncbi:MAG: hypothetical protein JWM93_3872 [Frankiales bacterium]|nr:hypothetical protein [Frankiales bacterium]
MKVADARLAVAALVACVRAHSGVEAVREAVLRADPAVLAKAARYHGVACLVAVRAAAAGVPVHPDIDTAYQSGRVRHLRSVAALRTLTPALDSVGAPWVVVKGPVLASAYERPDLRTYSDIDVLVDRRGLGRSIDALVGAGCSLVDRNWTLIDSQTRGEMSLLTDGGLALDLHWSLVNDARVRASLRMPVDDMLRRRVDVDLGGTTLPGLEPHDELAYVGLHAVMSGGHRLIWLTDLDRLTRGRPIDWDEAVVRARADRVALPLAIALARAGAILGTPVPNGVVRALAPALGWRSIARAADGLRSPLLSFTPGWSGRIVAQSVRSTTPASVAGLLHEVRSRLARRNEPPMIDNPLYVDTRDEAARARFLARVAALAH